MLVSQMKKRKTLLNVTIINRITDITVLMTILMWIYCMPNVKYSTFLYFISTYFWHLKSTLKHGAKMGKSYLIWVL